jgi:hypothetical protein
MTWVAEGVYAAGGNHIPNTWNEFHNQTGIQAILHLAPQHPQNFVGPSPRYFLWLDIEDESQADLTTRHLVGAFIRTCRERGDTVLLHGALGRHRTRWAYVAYQLTLGRKLETVLREAAEKPWLDPYPTNRDQWLIFYKEVHNSL